MIGKRKVILVVALIAKILVILCEKEHMTSAGCMQKVQGGERLYLQKLQLHIKGATHFAEIGRVSCVQHHF